MFERKPSVSTSNTCEGWKLSKYCSILKLLRYLSKLVMRHLGEQVLKIYFVFILYNLIVHRYVKFDDKTRNFVKFYSQKSMFFDAFYLLETLVYFKKSKSF